MFMLPPSGVCPYGYVLESERPSLCSLVTIRLHLPSGTVTASISTCCPRAKWQPTSGARRYGDSTAAYTQTHTRPCMLRPHSHNPYWYGIMAFIFAVTCIHILKYVYTLSINTSLHTYLHHPKFVSNRSQSSQIITVGTAVTAVAAVAAFASPAASPPPTSPLSPSPPAISNSCRQSPSNTDTDAASRCVQHLPQYTIPHLEQRVGRGHW